MAQVLKEESREKIIGAAEKEFLESGFDLDNELPDYLPAILELAASVDREQASKILKVAKSKIELLRDRFIEAKLAHAFLLDVVLTQAAGLEATK